MTTRPPSGELAEALRRAGLESLEPVFAAHDVDDRVLRDLTDADLRDLGLTLGQRKRLLAEVAGLDAPGARGPAGNGAFEMRRMSVLFCDLVESTELARRLSPDDLYDVLQSYYQTAGEVARRFRGGIASLQGDGIVALFGYPEATGADAEMAIGAGLALLDELRARRHRLSDGRLVAIEARVGIASGASAIGRSRLGFMVAEEIHAVGPTPNLAARLQSRAEPGWVVVDDRTRELTRDLFEFEPRPPADLKGFEGPVGVWRALRRRGGADRFTALRRSERPLVGREAELAALSALWAQARTGRGRLLRVVGEAGQGKSRLLARLEADAAAEGARTVRLDCSPLSAHAPLQPVIDRIESVVGRAGGRPPALRLAALRRAMPGADADAVGQVAALLSIEGAGGPARSGPEARAALFAALGDLLLGDDARPALIVLEDAHFDNAVDGLVWGAFFNAGQVCASVQRIYVAKPLYERFVERFVEATRALRLSTDRDRADVGALTCQMQLDVVERMVARAREEGARVLTGGKRPEGLEGLFYEPTVLVGVEQHHTFAQEEVFGPVVMIAPFTDEDEAVRLANDTRYGLHASVWSRDVARAERVARRIEAGAVSVNDHLSMAGIPDAPWGGIKDSGLGVIGSRRGLEACVRKRHIHVNRLPGIALPWWFPESVSLRAGMKALGEALAGEGWGRRARAAWGAIKHLRRSM